MEVEEFIMIVSIASSVLTIILFFKVWKMCNNVNTINNCIVKATKDNEDPKEKITKLIFNGRYKEAEELLDDTLVSIIAGIYYPESFDDDKTLANKLRRRLEDYEPYYKKMGKSIPDRFKKLTPNDIINLYNMKKGIFVDDPDTDNK